MWDGVDRRLFDRAQYPCLITVRKNTLPRDAILTHTEDISVGGVRVTIGKRLELMAEVDLEIDLQDTQPNVFAKAAVSWSQEITRTQGGRHPRYDTGIRFLGLKDEDRRRIQRIVDNFLGKG